MAACTQGPTAPQQQLPGWVALIVLADRVAALGAWKRRPPVGAAAKGTPSHLLTPLSVKPRTQPAERAKSVRPLQRPCAWPLSNSEPESGASCAAVVVDK